LAWKALLAPAPQSTEAPNADARLHLAMADRAYAERDYAAAMVGYQHAGALSPEDARAHRGLMRARVCIAANEPGRITPEAAQEIQYEATFLLENEPEERALWLTALGNALLAAQRVAEGAKSLEEAARTAPASAVTQTALGLLLLRNAESRSAGKAQLEAAVALAPQHLPALIPLAQLSLGEGDTARARELAHRVLSVREDNTARQILEACAAARTPQSAPIAPIGQQPAPTPPPEARP
jgi:Flp pilus assembly protein TadD